MGVLGEIYMLVLVIRVGDVGLGCGCLDWVVFDCCKGLFVEVGLMFDFGFFDDFS